MAQVKRGARGFLSSQIDVQSLIEQRGDIHHIFPKKYLQKNGVDNRKDSSNRYSCARSRKSP